MVSTGKRIGIVIPSSNVVVEPLAAQRFAATNVSVHFSRLGVFDVTLNAVSEAQFETQAHVAAANLLVDARVDALVWGGTSASWLGMERDIETCGHIQQLTNVPTTSCVQEMNRIAVEQGAKRIAMVTPYTDDVHQKILNNYQDQGFARPTGVNLGGTVSNDFASISEDVLENAIRQAAQTNPDVVMIMCTNLRAAAVAQRLSKQLALPIIDSADATLSAGLRIGGA
jgi:maleate isomerase